MRLVSYFSIFVLLSGLAAVAGCASQPRIHYYVLWADNQTLNRQNDPPPKAGLNVGVETFQVDPPYDQDRIVYRPDPKNAEIGFYAYHRWAAPLARMLPKIVADGLRGTTGLALIEPVKAEHTYDARLAGHLLSLEEIDKNEEHAGYVRIELMLRCTDGTVIWSNTVSGEATTRTRTVVAIVESMRKALFKVIDESRITLTSTLSHNSVKAKCPKEN